MKLVSVGVSPSGPSYPGLSVTVASLKFGVPGMELIVSYGNTSNITPNTIKWKVEFGDQAYTYDEIVWLTRPLVVGAEYTVSIHLLPVTGGIRMIPTVNGYSTDNSTGGAVTHVEVPIALTSMARDTFVWGHPYNTARCDISTLAASLGTTEGASDVFDSNFASNSSAAFTSTVNSGAFSFAGGGATLNNVATGGIISKLIKTF